MPPRRNPRRNPNNKTPIPPPQPPQPPSPFDATMFQAAFTAAVAAAVSAINAPVPSGSGPCALPRTTAKAMDTLGNAPIRTSRTPGPAASMLRVG